MHTAHKNDEPYYVNPKLQTPLWPTAQGLVCPETGSIFKIVNGVPRFCNQNNYSDSFAFQWNNFRLTQLDLHAHVKQSEERFYAETGWKSAELGKDKVLEVGSGAGRFTEVFLRTTTGDLHSIDYSSAVEANRLNNLNYGRRLKLCQASIYEIPYPDGQFDKVFCLGVLQHTPAFKDAIRSLVRKTRIGGEIVVDFYPIKGWYTKIHAKYLLRPITKRLPKFLLLRLIRWNIAWLSVVFELLCALRLGLLTRFLPITDLRNLPVGLSQNQRHEWAILDTFDGLSPEFDNPQRVRDVIQMFNLSGCEVSYAGVIDYTSGTAMVVRAIRREILRNIDTN